MILIDQIVSGGQTGADEAALAWAILRGVPHGGWCPRGRRNESGTIPDVYELKETPSEGFAQRTEWNVRDSDATVIFSIRPELEGGSLLTLDLAKRWKRPWIHISREATPDPVRALTEFLDRNFVTILNVAGPRASTEAGIGDFVKGVLDHALSPEP